MSFALEIYDALHSDAELQAEENLRYYFAERSGKEGADPSISKQLETYKNGEKRRTEELSEFVAFIRTIADEGPLSGAFIAPHQVHFGGRTIEEAGSQAVRGHRNKEDLVDLDRLLRYWLSQPEVTTYSMIKIASLLEGPAKSVYPEVVSILFVCLVLEACPSEDEINLDLVL